MPRRIVLCFCYQQFTTIYLHWKHNQVVECFVVFFLTQDIADSKILSLALVTLPTEKENWIVAGTHSGSLWAVNTEDETRRHRLQKMSDSVTCLYCNSLSKQRYTWLLNLLCYVSKMPLNRDVQWQLYIREMVLFKQLPILSMFALTFVPSITGNYIPDHRWLYLLIGFSETLEAAEVTNLILSHLIRAFFLKSLFYFVLFYFSKQKNFFLVGTADGTLAVFEDRAVKVDLFFLVCSKNAASNM